MRKKRILFFLTFFLFCVYSQPTVYSQNSSGNSEHNSLININIFGEVDFGSKFFSYPFLQTIIFGGTISDEMKLKVYNRLHDRNDFHSDIHYGVNISWTNQKGHHLGFKWIERHFTEVEFSKNFFHLLMYGNASWDTLCVNLGEQSLYQFTYSDLQLIYQFPEIQFKENLYFQFSLAPALRLGHNMLHINLPNSWIQTTVLSEIMRVQTDVRYRQNRNNFVGGIGAGLDIYASLKGDFKNQKGEWQIRIFTQDIGFIRWNKKSVLLNHQYDIHFDGIEIEPSLTANSNIFNKIQDSILNEIDKHSLSKAFYAATPSAIHLESNIFFHTSDVLSVGATLVSSVDIEPHPIYYIGLIPSLIYRSEKNDKFNEVGFCLPLTYNNLSGFGIGGGIHYHAIRYSKSKSQKIHYNCQLLCANIGFLAAAATVGLQLGIGIEKLH